MANSFYTAYQAVFSAVKAVLDYVPAVPGVPGVPAHDGEPEIPEVPEVPASGVAKTVFVGENFALTPDTPVILIDASSSPIVPLGDGLGVGCYCANEFACACSRIGSSRLV